MKSWLSMRDRAVRPDHVTADGQTVSLTDPFLVGGWPMDHPHDLNAPAEQTANCRCTVRYLYPGDIADDGTVVEGEPFDTERKYRSAEPLSDADIDEILAQPRTGEGDRLLANLYRKQGFDGLPAVVGKEEFERLAGQRGARRFHRGMSSPTEMRSMRHPDPQSPGLVRDYAEELRHGNYFPGVGIFGNGTYTAYGNRALETAWDYAGPQANGGQVIEGLMRPGSKIVDHEALMSEHARWTNDPNNRYISRELKILMSDPGRFATAQGYDAIRVKRGAAGGPQWAEGYLVILNRTATVIAEANLAPI